MAGTQPVPLPIPTELQSELAGYSAEAVREGCSGAKVFRMTAAGEPTLFLKVERAGPCNELLDEADRLRWLGAVGIGCAQVVRSVHDGVGDWLLMSEVPGRDLSCASDLEPVQIAEIMADALSALHTLPTAECPFDMRLDPLLARAAERAEAGLVDEQDFDAEHLGLSAADLLPVLLSRRPPEQDLVVTHGDACLPNLIALGDRFAGFIDCARLGLSDRYRDLALAARSIAGNLGAEFVGSFFLRYGIEPDQQRLAYYRLLDEFF
ncbi:MAG TPA: APH(3') family aminoglycoside O-phosphotransferase [Allosphingosinicella sp.]|jgi:aminoglycoside 3'-phosphotransferase-2